MAQTMDLRRRLVSYLGALLLCLLLMTVLINLNSLRHDVTAEVVASEQLVRVLLETVSIEGNLPAPEATRRVKAILDSAPLRHLSISLADIPPTEPDALTNQLAQLLGVQSTSSDGQMLRLGEQTLRIAPNPASEIEERLGDTVRLCITLLLFSGATLLVAWWSADRALAPVRQLEDGLHRLTQGESDAALPPFALREFNQVASAINHLAEALRTSRQAQRQLSRQLIQVQEEERRTLARELHDEMGQTLTAISVTAAYLERNAEKLEAGRIVECAQDLRRDVRTSGEQLRAMLQHLRPYGLDAQGVTSALRELVSSWQQRESGIRFSLEMPSDLPPLADEVGLALYRVIQEALTNVVRHSGAKHCRVNIVAERGTLCLEVVDDGCGLPAAGPSRRGGLLGIEERLAMVGGSLVFKNGQTQGLHLQITLPMSLQEQEENT
jgi:two-component system sensor histidine kinase UhpB